jgi:hypothetical protein
MFQMSMNTRRDVVWIEVTCSKGIGLLFLSTTKHSGCDFSSWVDGFLLELLPIFLCPYELTGEVSTIIGWDCNFLHLECHRQTVRGEGTKGNMVRS